MGIIRSTMLYIIYLLDSNYYSIIVHYYSINSIFSISQLFFLMEKESFEKLSLEFSNAQNLLNELMSARSQLETQYQENKIVLAEFVHLNKDSKIYKLTGPVLLPQQYDEAKLNVNKRIEFIEGEIQRVETKIEGEQKNIETAREKLVALRQGTTA